MVRNRPSHGIDRRPGNVGVDFKFISDGGFGWMNASYQIGLCYLNDPLRKALGGFVPVEKAFKHFTAASVAVNRRARPASPRPINDEELQRLRNTETGSGEAALLAFAESAAIASAAMVTHSELPTTPTSPSCDERGPAGSKMSFAGDLDISPPFLGLGVHHGRVHRRGASLQEFPFPVVPEPPVVAQDSARRSPTPSSSSSSAASIN